MAGVYTGPEYAELLATFDQRVFMRSQLQHLSSTSLALALGKAAHTAYNIGKKYIPPIIHTI